MRTVLRLVVIIACGGLATAGLTGCPEQSSSLGPSSSSSSLAAEPKAPEWQLLASELPSALLSVSGRSASDMFAVGADKGQGPLVLHFDGTKWKELHTGQSGDLWWVQAIAGGPTLMSGAGGMVLRYDGQHFERMMTPGLGRQTVYGVWGKSGDDFYAVGSAAGRNGFIWHYQAGKFTSEPLPLDLPRVTGAEVPGFFKAWGSGDDVWVVGSGGTILHRKGMAAFTVVPSGAKDTLFTVNGTGDRELLVGGASNGVLLEGTRAGVFRDVSPPNTGLLQGVFASDKYGDWVSGERGYVYTRKGPGPFAVAEHGLSLPAQSSLHSIFVDDKGGVWSAGGNVLTPALDGGMLIHFGQHMSPVIIDDADAQSPEHVASAAMPKPDMPAVCPAAVLAAGKSGTIARRWDEQILAGIRLDTPRPTVHSRNLFHMSAAMWDAWAGYETKGEGVFVRERHTSADVDKARRAAISYAAYGVLAHRYKMAIGAKTTLACLDAVMADLGYDPADTHTADKGSDDPIAFGNRIAHTIIAARANDGANEEHDCSDPVAFHADNPPLVYDNPGAPLKDPQLWQPINLSVAATQNGIVQPAGVQVYIGSQWGAVTPFAMKNRTPDPGPVPQVRGQDMKRWLVEVIRKTAEVDTTSPATIDTSPGAYGHNSLAANDGKGWGKNPVTGEPYAPQVIPKSDFARVMAEFWADGPTSETPPGHWNVLANQVSDSPGFKRQLFGKGPVLDPLSWDVHVYLALNGAEHDAAITAWGIKRRYTTVRPISLIRWMGGKGQSSDPKGPSYDPDGLPIVPGLIEVITKESSAPGERQEKLAFFVGQVAIRDWLGEPGDRANQVSGVGWVRAVDWTTYQRRTFVTPSFPGFISGHSTFSRAGAEVLASVTGSPYFPGGLAEYVAPKDKYLFFERGPSVDVHLQWASYFDASDEAGQSRVWGGIHIEPDDFAGRRLGHQVGLDAVALASKYFDGTAKP